MEKIHILTPLSFDEAMVIEKITDSRLVLARVDDVFKAGIDYYNFENWADNFEKWESDKPNIDTEEIEVKVFKLTKSAKYTDIFGSFQNSLDEVCVTPAQIVRFCEKYPEKLGQKDENIFQANIFLIKENEKHVVVLAYMESCGPSAKFHRIDNKGIWNADYLYHIFVPATCRLKA
ncbi:MAG: hypothetical protein WCK37_03605 [Candidatus Falkowbacteria bacterium]